MPTTTFVKRCVQCSKDVTTEQRMKDSSGRYWCLVSGTADQKKKSANIARRPHAPSDATGKGRLLKMLVAMGVLGALVIWRFSAM